MKDEDDDLFNDALDALDNLTVDTDSEDAKKSGQTKKKEASEQKTTFEPPFPYAPAINDPNIKMDENTIKYLADSQQYEKLIDTMINMLRVDSQKVDKNQVA